MFTDLITPPPAAQADALERFTRLLHTAWADGSFVSLLLSRPIGAESASSPAATARAWPSRDIASARSN